jgi:UDP-glucose 4-epimerase
VPHAIVTGAGGFIGRPVVAHLTKSGHTVTAWTDPLNSLSGHTDPADVVVHLAASSRHGDVPADDRVDAAATEAVIDYCRAHRAACVFASTAGVYRRNDTPRQDEDAPIGPENAYAARKLAAELRWREACEQFGISCIALRLFNVYGPGQRAPFIVPYVVETLTADQPLELRMPDAIRDFVFVHDVARAFAAAAASGASGFQAINIGSGEGTRVRDLVMMVAQILGKAPTWGAAAERFPEVPSSVADIRRARANLGWAPAVALQDGLRAACAP